MLDRIVPIVYVSYALKLHAKYAHRQDFLMSHIALAMSHQVSGLESGEAGDLKAYLHCELVRVGRVKILRVAWMGDQATCVPHLALCLWLIVTTISQPAFSPEASCSK